MKIKKYFFVLLLVSLSGHQVLAATKDNPKDKAKDKAKVSTTIPQEVVKQPTRTIEAPPAANKISTKTNDIDRVIAVVNREVITEQELNLSINIVKEKFIQSKQPLPPQAVIEKEMLAKLIDDSIIYQEANNVGGRVLDGELDGIISNMAIQKKMTLEQFKQAVEQDGIRYDKFRQNLRRDVIITRFKEREVDSKVKLTDAEIEAFISSNKPRTSNAAVSSAPDLISLAQILIPIPTGASNADISALKLKAQSIFDQVSKETDFVAYANQVSVSDKTIRFENLGYRTLDRLPQIFVEATSGLSTGAVVPKVIQSLAGFHVLKVLDFKSNSSAGNASNSDSIFITQSEMNQLILILKRGDAKEDLIRRLRGFSEQVKAKTASFADIAKKYSEDPNATKNNGYAGWVSPGQIPPEMEIALRRLNPGEVSEPFQTDYGWHIVQLLNRRTSEITAGQQKEYASATLRQMKLQKSYQDWITELRDNSTIDVRAPYSLKNVDEK
jgi:peptidyl-prolyl cis-trans isomerase SurA